MSEIYLVARREYLENLRTKAFWIGILAFPLILAVAALVPILLAQVKEVRTYAVLDRSGFLLQRVEERVFAEDLREVFRVASSRQRRSGEAFSGLPEPVRRFTRVAAELDREQRELFFTLLARSDSSEGEAAGLPEEARGALRQVGPALRQWWQDVPARELGEVDMDLAKTRYTRVPVPDAAEEPEAALNSMINEGGLFAYFAIGPDPVASDEGCRYVSNNQTDRDLLGWFSRRAEGVIRERRIAREGIDPEIARWIQRPLAFQERKVSEKGAEEKVETRDKARQWAPLAFVYMLWIAIFTSAQMLLTNTIEEKSNRALEVLLSSVTSHQLMVGKIAGMAATGLTVVGSWAGCFIALVVIVPGMLGIGASFLGEIAADPFYMLSFILYFLMGYLFYASLLAAIGSVCSSIKDSQNLMLPILVPMLIPLLAMIPIGRSPNGIVARVFSFIPPFTPFVMMNRAAGPPALWEYIATTLLMLGAIALAMRAAAKVFRIGILMTGKPPRLLEIARWMALSEAANPASEETT